MFGILDEDMGIGLLGVYRGASKLPDFSLNLLDLQLMLLEGNGLLQVNIE